GQAEVEIVAGARAEPVELRLQTDGADFDSEPGVDGRVGQGIGRLPAGGAVLERDGRIEGAGLEAKSIAGAGVRTELQVRRRHSHGAAVLVVPGVGVEVRTPQLAERCRECEARPPELNSGVVAVVAGGAETSVHEG